MQSTKLSNKQHSSNLYTSYILLGSLVAPGMFSPSVACFIHAEMVYILTSCTTTCCALHCCRHQLSTGDHHLNSLASACFCKTNFWLVSLCRDQTIEGPKYLGEKKPCRPWGTWCSNQILATGPLLKSAASKTYTTIRRLLTMRTHNMTHLYAGEAPAPCGLRHQV